MPKYDPPKHRTAQQFAEGNVNRTRRASSTRSYSTPMPPSVQVCTQWQNSHQARMTALTFKMPFSLQPQGQCQISTSSLQKLFPQLYDKLSGASDRVVFFARIRKHDLMVAKKAVRSGIVGKSERMAMRKIDELLKIPHREVAVGYKDPDDNQVGVVWA